MRKEKRRSITIVTVFVMVMLLFLPVSTYAETQNSMRSVATPEKEMVMSYSSAKMEKYIKCCEPLTLCVFGNGKQVSWFISDKRIATLSDYHYHNCRVTLTPHKKGTVVVTCKIGSETIKQVIHITGPEFKNPSIDADNDKVVIIDEDQDKKKKHRPGEKSNFILPEWETEEVYVLD